MIVRIRVRRAARRGSPRWDRRLAQAAGALLTPAAAVALALAFWRLGADLQLTARFVITHGILSHWQAWLLIALALQGLGSLLARYGAGPRSSRRAAPSGEGDQAIP
ncbi:MAG: hypothetical protein ACP5U2_05240 [Bryobacteraceae bacterium]